MRMLGLGDGQSRMMGRQTSPSSRLAVLVDEGMMAEEQRCPKRRGSLNGSLWAEDGTIGRLSTMTGLR